MTAKTPDFLHGLPDRKPATGFDYAQKSTIAPVKPNPEIEHRALINLIEADALDLAPMLGLDTHTCQRCDHRRNAS